MESKPILSARSTDAMNAALKLAMSSRVIVLGTQVCSSSNGT